MKKWLILPLTLLSATSFAEEAKLHVGLFEVNSAVSTPIPGNKYSISNDKLRLCWVVFGTTFPLSNNKAIEIFKSPAKAKFIEPDSSVESLNDGKTNKITSFVQSYNGESISRCWKFDNSDPLGHYTLEINVNNMAFPAQSFELVK